MFIVKYQREGTNRYIAEECATMDDFIQCIVDVAQCRGKGWKYRLMEFGTDDNNATVARFDVQYTKVAD